MISRLVSFVTGGAVSKYIMAGLAGLALTFSGLWLYMSVQAANLETQIEAQRTEIILLSNEVDTFKKNVKLQKESSKVLEQRIVKERIEALQLQDRLRKIEDAPESENGDVSPVLRGALDRL